MDPYNAGIVNRNIRERKSDITKIRLSLNGTARYPHCFLVINRENTFPHRKRYYASKDKRFDLAAFVNPTSTSSLKSLLCDSCEDNSATKILRRIEKKTEKIFMEKI